MDRDVAKKISGHLTDITFSRYNITDEHDIKAAKRKVNAAAAHAGKPEISEGLLKQLTSIPEEKLRALLALIAPL